MSNRFAQIAEEIRTVLSPTSPRLNRTLQDRLEVEDFELSTDELRCYLKEGSAEDAQPLITFFLSALETDGELLRPTTDTAAGSSERFDWIVSRLGLTDVREELQARLPKPEPIVIVDQEFRNWYTPERESEHSNYWKDYVSVLERNGWDARSISTVENQAREVLRRIEDPTAEHYVSSRGLVVGYVQSGKTANFTAVAAKAIDAGYRLIIVLAGTLDNLRNQTQRRLDKELFGREAVLAGIDEDDMTVKQERSEAYFSGEDEEWDRHWNNPGKESAFIEHGPFLGAKGFPWIKRLTTSADDYRVRTGANPLNIEIPDKNRPIHDPENLFNMPCMVAVMKKNASVLQGFNADLRRAFKVNSALKDLPVLVIDDEADQASINTKNNTKRDAEEEKKRTAVNAEITNLLKICPRAQYIGYTATPFANVFVDPSDPEDLYPRHYVLMLNEPPAYRGAKWFHDRTDFIDNPDEATLETSRSEAFIRNLAEESDICEEDFDDVRMKELQTALDMFVLTGAIKLYRHDQNMSYRFKHHTMLVHEHTGQDTHENAKKILEELWRSRGYNLGRPIPELKQLFDSDLLPVMRIEEYSAGAPYPETYEALHPYVAKAYAEMMKGVERGNAPILQVDSRGGDVPDFEAGRVWKVMVGGAKLSRGYTVEGLTVSYFRRRTAGADTLMQTGRWFGFRKGYQDLVRLYAPPTLVEMFEAAMHDEEVFRANIRAYEELEEFGNPRLTPMRLAPLVQQSRPDLKPTARNKMFNSYLVKSASAPEVVDMLTIPDRSDRVRLAANFSEVALPLLRVLGSHPEEMAYVRIRNRMSEHFKLEPGTLNAYLGIMPSPQFIGLLETMRWHEGSAYKENFINPRLRYLRELAGTGRHSNHSNSDFADVAILLPVPKKRNWKTSKFINVPGITFPVPLVRRSRREGRHDITATPLTYRYIAQTIAAGDLVSDIHPDDAAAFDPEGTLAPKFAHLQEPEALLTGNNRARGSVVLTLFDDREQHTVKAMELAGHYTPPSFEKGEVGVALAFNSPHYPVLTNRGVLEWSVRLPSKDGEDPITIDANEVNKKLS